MHRYEHGWKLLTVGQRVLMRLSSVRCLPYGSYRKHASQIIEQSNQRGSVQISQWEGIRSFALRCAVKQARGSMDAQLMNCSAFEWIRWVEISLLLLGLEIIPKSKSKQIEVTLTFQETNTKRWKRKHVECFSRATSVSLEAMSVYSYCSGIHERSTKSTKSRPGVRGNFEPQFHLLLAETQNWISPSEKVSRRATGEPSKAQVMLDGVFSGPLNSVRAGTGFPGGHVRLLHLVGGSKR